MSDNHLIFNDRVVAINIVWLHMGTGGYYTVPPTSLKKMSAQVRPFFLDKNYGLV